MAMGLIALVSLLETAGALPKKLRSKQSKFLLTMEVAPLREFSLSFCFFWKLAIWVELIIVSLMPRLFGSVQVT
jgi:hypothetical protein